MKCEICFKEVDNSNKFCPFCGHKLTGDICREPGEVKIMRQKVSDIIAKSEELPFPLGVALAIYVNATFQWYLGKLNDEQYLKLYSPKEEAQP